MNPVFQSILKNSFFTSWPENLTENFTWEYFLKSSKFMQMWPHNIGNWNYRIMKIKICSYICPVFPKALIPVAVNKWNIL